MKRNALAIVLASFTTTVVLGSAVGCASSSADDAASSGADLSGASAEAGAPTSSSTGSPLAAAMKGCKSVEQNATNASSTAEMVDAENAIAQCYENAVDSDAAEIDKLKAAASGTPLTPKTAKAAAYYKAFRETRAVSGTATMTFCDLGDKVDSSFGGSLATVDRASCDADTATLLAQIVLSEAKIAGSTPIPTSSGGEAALRATVGDLITAWVTNDQTADQTAVATSVGDVVDGAVKSSLELCSLLADAGPMAGSSGAKTRATACQSNVLALIAKRVKTMLASPDGGDDVPAGPDSQVPGN